MTSELIDEADEIAPTFRNQIMARGVLLLSSVISLTVLYGIWRMAHL